MTSIRVHASLIIGAALVRAAAAVGIANENANDGGCLISPDMKW